MAIFKNSRFTDSFVYLDDLDEDIVFLEVIVAPRFSPSKDDLLLEIVSGDRLDLIAKKFYGDEVLDWVLLEANPNLKSPFDLKSGDILRVPLPEKVSDILG